MGFNICNKDNCIQSVQDGQKDIMNFPQSVFQFKILFYRKVLTINFKYNRNSLNF